MYIHVTKKGHFTQCIYTYRANSLSDYIENFVRGVTSYRTYEEYGLYTEKEITYFTSTADVGINFPPRESVRVGSYWEIRPISSSNRYRRSSWASQVYWPLVPQVKNRIIIIIIRTVIYVIRCYLNPLMQHQLKYSRVCFWLLEQRLQNQFSNMVILLRNSTPKDHTVFASKPGFRTAKPHT